jgi:anaphase-promoting complex subunit 3
MAHQQAEATFLALRRLDPMRLDGLEIHSTLLWHLRKEVELCALAQQAMELDRRAPQCLCVVGNCFALQKEHESALKFFLRAVQIEPQNPYAHTLAGHEHVANEEFDRGLDFFRAAILAEPRHYNAWYGLGYVYYRQEKYDLAEYHFRRALAINANSSVLWCYLGLGDSTSSFHASGYGCGCGCWRCCCPARHLRLMPRSAWPLMTAPLSDG